MTTQDDAFYEAIAEVRDMVESLCKATDEEPASVPDVHSPAMREISHQPDYVGDWGDEPVEHAHTIGVWKRALAVDCAQAMTRDLRDDPAPIFAHKVLSRAAIENAASAAWILEPGIGVRKRIARGRNERLYSARQILRLEWLPDEERQRSSDIVERITRVGEGLGFTITNGWLEEDRPGFTKLLRWMLGDDLGETIANYYSAVAHGTQYGLASAVMSVESPPGGIGMPRAAIGLSSHDVNLALATAGMGLIRAIDHERELMGRAVENWEQTRSQAMSTFSDAVIHTFSADNPSDRGTD